MARGPAAGHAFEVVRGAGASPCYGMFAARLGHASAMGTGGSCFPLGGMLQPAATVLLLKNSPMRAAFSYARRRQQPRPWALSLRAENPKKRRRQSPPP
jgi:hypothetical protein